MTATALSILPTNWDTAFFLQLAGVTNHYGFEPKQDGIHFKYLGADYDAVMAAFDAYPTAYLSVMRPDMLVNLANERKSRIDNFQYYGSPLPLDPESRANLVGAVVGLDRNPSVLEISWKVSSGIHIALPRATIYDMADQAFLYVQACFSHEKAMAEQINAATDIYELGAIQLDQGWPLYPGQTE